MFLRKGILLTSSILPLNRSSTAQLLRSLNLYSLRPVPFVLTLWELKISVTDLYKTIFNTNITKFMQCNHKTSFTQIV